MKKILPRMLCVFIATLMFAACSIGGASPVPSDIAFTPKAPEELVAQARNLLGSETRTDDEALLDEIAHFAARLEQALANKNGSEEEIKDETENEIKIAALYLQTSLDKRIVNLDRITIPQIQDMIREGKISYQELTHMYLSRIELYDKNTINLNAIIALNPNAMEEAKRADEAERKDPAKARGMFGIPVLLKDNINFDKLPTTAGAMALSENIPPYNAALVDSLLNTGAIILGKANLAEFAGMMDMVVSSVGGMTRHPYRPQVLIGDSPFGASPGGSSSGPAVSVAAALAQVTVGTETQGSLLGPASMSCVATIKPTVGLISRYGIIPLQLSQDSPGPMARNVADLAVLLNVMTSGVDERDSKTLALTDAGVIGVDYTQSLRLDGLSGKRIGILNIESGWGLDESERGKVDLVIKTLEAAGVTLVKSPDGNYLDYPTYPSFQEYPYYEFKKGLNAYLATLAPDFPIKTLSDIVAYNNEHPEVMPNGQATLIEADNTNIAEVEEKYEAMIKEAQDLAGPQGIDALLKEYDLDALMFIDYSTQGAVAGYPTVSVPFHYNKDSVSSSVNVIFTGAKFSEALLLEVAYVVEQGTHFRLTPGLADKRELGEAFEFIMDKESELINAALAINENLGQSEALRFVIKNNEDLNGFSPELDIYYDGLATQFEVDEANARTRALISQRYAVID
ncbi:MAG: amidase family protein [Firmicutes bacterium]|nr:amidase family protein [Bacillota bacterium]